MLEKRVLNESIRNCSNEPRHEKTCFSHMRTTKAQVCLRIHKLICVLPCRKSRRQVFSWIGSNNEWTIEMDRKVLLITLPLYFDVILPLWAATWQNQQSGMCAQRRLRHALSKQLRIFYLAARPIMLFRFWCESSQRNNNFLTFLLIQIQNTCRCRIQWERSFSNIRLACICQSWWSLCRANSKTKMWFYDFKTQTHWIYLGL